MKPTLKTLADSLNVSVSTVSKALNDSHEISEATKKIVREQAEKHNYRPNAIAQFLKTGKTNTVGVILPRMSGVFESQILEGVQKVAFERDFRVLIMNSLENETIERNAINEMVGKAVDGILFCPTHENSNVDLVRRTIEHTPLVIFDRTNYPVATHKVGVQNTEGTYAACKHLFAIGRRDVAVLCGVHQGITADRLAGYIRAHKDFDIPIQGSFINYLKVRSVAELRHELAEKVRKLIALPHPPNAILGVSDTITTHLLGILADLGIAVPERLAVLGFANTDLAASLNPSLTTIRQPTGDIGEIAMQKLLELIKRKAANRETEWEDIKLPTTIQFRKSTKGEERVELP